MSTTTCENMKNFSSKIAQNPNFYNPEAEPTFCGFTAISFARIWKMG